jgi:hypothetical protein
MVQAASSSKSNRSQAKSTHAAIKFGPPAKKLAAVSIAKEKQIKQSGIKKGVRTGNYFFCCVVAHLMLIMNR